MASSATSESFFRDLKKLIVERRTIHDFVAEPVPKSVLEEALYLGSFAPNHKQKWPWRFVVISPTARDHLAELFVEQKEKKSKEPLTPVVRASFKQRFLDPGAAVVLTIARDSDEVLHRENYASMACAVQNISLYLWSVGWGTKWSTGGIVRSPKLFELIGYTASEVDVCGVLWVGKPKEVPTTPERPQLEDIIKTV